MFKNLLLASIAIACQTPNTQETQNNNFGHPKEAYQNTDLSNVNNQVLKNYTTCFATYYYNGSQRNLSSIRNYNYSIQEQITQNKYVTITKETLILNSLRLVANWNEDTEQAYALGKPVIRTKIIQLIKIESFSANAQIDTLEIEDSFNNTIKDQANNTYNIDYTQAETTASYTTIIGTLDYLRAKDNILEIKNLNQTTYETEVLPTPEGQYNADDPAYIYYNAIEQLAITEEYESYIQVTKSKNKIQLLTRINNETDENTNIETQYLINYVDLNYNGTHTTVNNQIRTPYTILKNITNTSENIITPTNYQNYINSLSTTIDGTTYPYLTDMQLSTYNSYNIAMTLNINTAGGTASEVIDIVGIMWDIIAMPFAFIRQAFNVTIFEGTPYQFNFATAFRAVIAVLAILFIVKLFTHGIDTLGNYTGNVGKLADRHNKNQMQKKQLKQEDRKIAETERHNKAMESKKDK